MPAVIIPRGGRVATNGSALVIVLFFIVLLSVVTIAFLARSLTAVKVSASSAGETKSRILAASASDIVIGDMRQEMIAGSGGNVGTLNFPLYYPSSNTNAVPFLSGVPTPGTTIPNLIRRSVNPNTTTGAAPYVPYPNGAYTSTLTPPNRAANDPNATPATSTSLPSLNGRYISAAQWNSHYLIPRPTSVLGTTSTDSTPVSTFVVPDWVVVTRAGANSVTWSSGTGGLNDPTLTNTNCAVGRYAYAVYNEGGTLDMNAAGYPSDPASPGASGSNGLTSAQASQKGSLALADLTQLTAGSTSLTQAQINNFVGWRNYASSKFTAANGSFGSFTFSPSTSSNWMTNFVSANTTNGFMQIVPPPTGQVTPPTDQALLSRQQLISIIQALNISPDFLQYMGTFSRGLEQPSYVANTNLPKIVGTITPPAPSVITTYQGNNTYLGGETLINLRGTGFLGVRVATAFTRLDGTTAVIGEPLVKRKFALSRLALVTTGYSHFFSSALAASTAADPVYQRFGIYRTSASSPWIYDHLLGPGNTASSSSNPAVIAALSYLVAPAAGTTREPDFAELLKAAINVGSVGKAGPSGTGGNYQYLADVSGDGQILQLMANLIDQQKTDNYPTWIQYTQSVSGSATPVIRNIYGDQDLPYFYRWNYFNVTTKVPSPILASTDTITDAAGHALNHTKLLGAATLTPGACAYLIVPQVWNPHDANTPQASGGGPTQFRVVATTNFPQAPDNTTSWSFNAVPGSLTPTPVAIHFDGAPGGDEVADFPLTSPSLPAAAALSSALGSYIQFTDASGGKAFREPTILWRNNFPTGVTLSTPGGALQEDATALTGNSYYGIPVAKNVPVSWTWSDTDGKTYISQTSTLEAGPNVSGQSGGLPADIDFQMQYLNAANNWITYQESFVEYTLVDFPSYGLFVNKNEPSYLTSGGNPNAWQNPFVIGINASGAPFSRMQSGLYDPRTNRFAAGIAGGYTNDDPTLDGNPTLDAVTLVSNSNPSAAQNASVATSNFVLMKSDRPTTARGQSYNYTTPCRGYDPSMHWYSSPSTTVSGGNWNASTASQCSNFCDGLLSQNNPLLKMLSSDGSTVQSYYYEDADGIARRAMGGYVPVSGAPTGKLTNTTSTIGLPTATAGSTFTGGIETPSSQSQSRPILLHRPYRNVAEMSYAFRGSPWKNIDFFTPESGDSALLDVFCVNEPPSTAMVAGKVDLNTRQAPVLKALFSAAYRDEFANLATPPTSGTLPAISSTEAGNFASTLVGITSSHNAWEGPLVSVADLVGHFVFPDPGTLTATDVYQYTSPANSTEYTFSGFTAALSASTGTWDSANLASSQNIQRFRESAIRPLADCGQTRVWNLLIDVVAQTGRYPKTATGFDQFAVDGQTRLWVHVAIDRYTGQVIDKQVELVNQ